MTNLTSLLVTSPLGTRTHSFSSAKLAAYWAACWRGLGYEVTEFHRVRAEIVEPRRGARECFRVI